MQRENKNGTQPKSATIDRQAEKQIVYDSMHTAAPKRIQRKIQL